MTNDQFIGRFRFALLATGLVWRLYIALPVSRWDSAAFGVLLGMVPYVVLASLTGLIRNRIVLGVSALTALGLDVFAGLAATSSTSSTGGVAVMLAPICATVVIVPVALVAGWLSRFVGHQSNVKGVEGRLEE